MINLKKETKEGVMEQAIRAKAAKVLATPEKEKSVWGKYIDFISLANVAYEYGLEELHNSLKNTARALKAYAALKD